jgi:hypothetical protein
VLKNPAWHFRRIGLEVGPLSQWLYSALAEAGLHLCRDAAHAGSAEGPDQLSYVPNSIRRSMTSTKQRSARLATDASAF